MALSPIAFTERVVDDFLHDQLTTYPLADPDLYAQLRALLQLEETRKTPLRMGPFVSLSRPFKQGVSVVELVADGIFHPQTQALVPYPELRAHQEQAIRAVHAGCMTLLSTGTGSGKTEAHSFRSREPHDAQDGGGSGTRASSTWRPTPIRMRTTA